LQRAAFALQMRQFAVAEQIAADVLKASRTDAGAVSILARALMAQNRAGEAIPHLERAAKRSDDAGIATLLGAALGSAGKRAEATELLRRTAQRRPPFLPAFQELAGQLAGAGRFEEAIAIIESALALAPGAVDLELDLARLHLHRNDRAQARAILTRLDKVAPGRPDVLNLLGRVVMLEGAYPEAADAFRRALALRPDDALLRADLATGLLEMGDRQAGEAALRTALAGRPQMLGRATYALVHSAHGRFFFRQSAAKKFLGGEALKS
jgi:tetratricopeptide (TPR) repeat protein